MPQAHSTVLQTAKFSQKISIEVTTNPPERHCTKILKTEPHKSTKNSHKIAKAECPVKFQHLLYTCRLKEVAFTKWQKQKYIKKSACQYVSNQLIVVYSDHFLYLLPHVQLALY